MKKKIVRLRGRGLTPLRRYHEERELAYHMRELSKDYFALGQIANEAGLKVKAKEAMRKAQECLEKAISEEIRLFEEEQLSKVKHEE